jgi:hypothetical protein
MLMTDHQFILLLLTILIIAVLGFGTWAYVKGRETIFYLLAISALGFAFMGTAIGSDEPATEAKGQQ